MPFLFRRLPPAVAAVALLLTAGCGPGASARPAARPDVVGSPSLGPSSGWHPAVSDFDPSRDAAADVRNALRTARREHREVLVDFGADWCLDCVVLGADFRSSAVAPTLARAYVLVHVDVGRFDHNLALARRYVDLGTSGIPALVVLRADGSMRTNTSDGAFSDARGMGDAQVTAFLNRWAGGTR